MISFFSSKPKEVPIATCDMCKGGITESEMYNKFKVASLVPGGNLFHKSCLLSKFQLAESADKYKNVLSSNLGLKSTASKVLTAGTASLALLSFMGLIFALTR